jgi:hypothetical protein
MAGNERIWFRIRFGQAAVEDLYASPDYPGGGEFALADPAHAETDFATYAEEVTQAHMIDEYARHNGHADLIRELVDGATGL